MVNAKNLIHKRPLARSNRFNVFVLIALGAVLAGAGYIIYTATRASGTFPPTGRGGKVLVWTVENESSHDHRTWTKDESVDASRRFSLIQALQGSFKNYTSDIKTANPGLLLVSYNNGTHIQCKKNPDGSLPTSAPCYNFAEDWYSHTGEPATKENRIYIDFWGTYLMNPASTGWVDHVVGTCKTTLSVSHYDFCMLDELGLDSLGKRPINPSTHKVWTDTEWLGATSNIGSKVKAGSAKPVIGNGLGEGQWYFNRGSKSLFNGVDGGIAEAWLRPPRAAIGTFKSEAQWKQDVDMLVDAENAGKSVLTLTKTWGGGTADQKAAVHKYTLASYLLGANGKSYFSFTANEGDAVTTDHPWWHLDLGAPSGSYYKKSTVVYERDFAQGKAFVNPTGTASGVISLGGNYKNLDGATVSSITLAAHTGEVLTAGGGTDNSPTVSLTAPSAGASVSGTSLISANASDDHGVTKVEFYVDGTMLTPADTTSPYSFSWSSSTVSNGSHTLTAKAYDAASHITTSAPVSITVSNSTTTGPHITSINPTSGSGSGGTGVTISGTNFAAGATIKLGGTSATSVAASGSTTLTATAPAHALGLVDLLVTIGANSDTLRNAFTFADTTAPSTPTAAAATAPNSGQVNLSWHASTDTGGAGLSGYKIFRNGSSVALATVASSVTSFTDTNVFGNTNYSYTVSAFDNASPANASALSTPATVKTPPKTDDQAPSTPANLRIASKTYNGAAIAWDASTDAGGSGLAGYHIKRGANCEAIALAYVGDAAGTTFNNTGLSANTTYKYVVTAFDHAGNVSGPSSCLSVTTDINTIKPNAPTNVTATAPIAAQVNVGWSAATIKAGGTPLAGYHVWRNGQQIITLGANVLSYADNNVAASMSYSYTVSAFDQANPSNESDQSAAVTVKTPAGTDIEKPSKPQNLRSSAITANSINLDWEPSTDNVGVLGYHLYRNNQLIPISITSTHFSDTGLGAGGSYHYYVVAYDASANTSDPSTTLDIQTTQVVNVGGGILPTPVSGKIQLAVPMMSADIANVKYTVDNHPVSGETLDTTNLSDGKHVVSCTAEDKFGNQIACPDTTITVKNHDSLTDTLVKGAHKYGLAIVLLLLLSGGILWAWLSGKLPALITRLLPQAVHSSASPVPTVDDRIPVTTHPDDEASASYDQKG